MKTNQQGFTLIELMIVVAIIGILGAVAMPQYNKYTLKAKLSEVVGAASTCKGIITERYQTTNSPSSISGGNWGCEESSGIGNYVTSIATSTGGNVRLTVGNTGVTEIDGDFVYMVVNPNGSSGATTWTCGASSQDLLEVLPGSCQTDHTTVDPGAGWSDS